MGCTIDGLVSFNETAQPLVSQLAVALGLPAHSAEAVDAARSKVGLGLCACVKDEDGNGWQAGFGLTSKMR